MGLAHSMAAHRRGELDRDLLRRAGEHLGALAAIAHERYLLGPQMNNQATVNYRRWVALDDLSKKVLAEAAR